MSESSSYGGNQGRGNGSGRPEWWREGGVEDDDELEVLMWFKEIPPCEQEILLKEFSGKVKCNDPIDKFSGETEEEFQKIYKNLPPISQVNLRSRIYKEYCEACKWPTGKGKGSLEKPAMEADVLVDIENFELCFGSALQLEKGDDRKLGRFKVKSLDLRGGGGGSGGAGGGSGGRPRDASGGGGGMDLGMQGHNISYIVLLD